MDNALMPWLNRSARQITMVPGRFKGFNKFWLAVRSRTGIGIMFANIRNALQQLTGMDHLEVVMYQQKQILF